MNPSNVTPTQLIFCVLAGNASEGPRSAKFPGAERDRASPKGSIGRTFGPFASFDTLVIWEFEDIVARNSLGSLCNPPKAPPYPLGRRLCALPTPANARLRVGTRVFRLRAWKGISTGRFTRHLYKDFNPEAGNRA